MTYKWMSLSDSRSYTVGAISLSQTMDGWMMMKGLRKETKKPACMPYIPEVFSASFPSAIRDDTTLTRSSNEAGNTPE
jgi:hypothetical protein